MQIRYFTVDSSMSGVKTILKKVYRKIFKYFKTYWKYFALTALLVSCITLLCSPLFQTGLTFDEPNHITAAKTYWLYFEGVGRGVSPLRDELLKLWESNDEHPPLVKVLSSFTWRAGLSYYGKRITITRSIWAHRLAPIGFTVFGLVFVFLLTEKVGGGGSSLWAALSFLSIPHILGYGRLVAFDVPVASLWICSLYCFLKSRKSMYWGFLTGIVFGLSFLTKITAAMIPFTVLSWLLYQFILGLYQKEKELMSVYKEFKWGLIGMLVFSPLVFLIFWPAMWMTPYESFIEYVGFHLSHKPVPVYYLGQTYFFAPWHYPFVMTFISLPISIVVFSIVGMTQGIHKIRLNQAHPIGLIIFNLLVFYLLASIFPLKYDGVRLILPGVFLLVVLSGIGINWLLTPIYKSSNKSNKFRLIKCATIGIMISVVSVPGINYSLEHAPYEYTFYNSLIGGPSGAIHWGFEGDHWAQSYREVIPWLNRLAHQKQGEVTVFPVVGTGYLRCQIFEIYQKGDVKYLNLNQFLPEKIKQSGILNSNVKCVEDTNEADYFLLLTRQSRFGDLGWELFRFRSPLRSFQVAGVPLVQLYRKNPGKN